MNNVVIHILQHKFLEVKFKLALGSALLYLTDIVNYVHKRIHQFTSSPTEGYQSAYIPTCVHSFLLFCILRVGYKVKSPNFLSQ